MKTIITEIDMFKATIKPDGKIDVTLSGGKQFTGQLTAQEIEQLLFRISAMTDKTIAFEPEPQDLINVHAQDMETLEKQATALSERADTIANLEKMLADSNTDSTKKNDELNQALNEVDSLRKQLAKTRIELSEANEKLSVQIETKVEETPVHNVQTTEQTSSVHNVQSEEAAT